jgi:general secretion pathway protein A
MYHRFYGVNEQPFALNCDTRFLCLTPTHAEALAHLEHGIASDKGVTVLIGEAGTGKTTLLTAARERAARDTLFAHVSNPLLTRREFYEYVGASLGFPTLTSSSKALFVLKLTELVRQRHARGAMTGIAIDEAQCLTLELLEEIRLLANIESGADRPFHVVLVGQPELADKLNDPALRSLKQRVALRCLLHGMDLRETAGYIAGRIRVAGGKPEHLFTRDAVQLVFEASRGLPRLVNVLCDNALVTGFAAGVRPVNGQIVSDVCRDFDVQTFESADAAPPPAAGREEHREGAYQRGLAWLGLTR